jgi:GNAT superfamily N-acetyltransferase
VGAHVIRAARITEATALSALCCRSKAHWGYDAAFMVAAARLLAVPQAAIRAGRVLVAEADGAPAGVAVLVPQGGTETWELSHLFVEPLALGRGIGRALFQAAARKARLAGAGRLLILADPNAAGFYARMGAAPAGAVASDLDPQRMLPRYELDLHMAGPPVD